MLGNGIADGSGRVGRDEKLSDTPTSLKSRLGGQTARRPKMNRTRAMMATMTRIVQSMGGPYPVIGDAKPVVSNGRFERAGG
jgi:hypothetical protein